MTGNRPIRLPSEVWVYEDPKGLPMVNESRPVSIRYSTIGYAIKELQKASEGLEPNAQLVIEAHERYGSIDIEVSVDGNRIATAEEVNAYKLARKQAADAEEAVTGEKAKARLALALKVIQEEAPHLKVVEA